ncbi:hypothetical protein FACS189449_06580 [Alphaproteobacteria bacterium]|nr:hypothetical protein FACS189449_06580 [Alphaproteobacteria bacterium]
MKTSKLIIACAAAVVVASLGIADSAHGAAAATVVIAFDGGNYEGPVNAAGLRHGQGVVEYQNGHFEGMFENGAINGPGT